jgi:hypothetical protein
VPRHERQQNTARAGLEDLSLQQVRAVRRIVAVALATLTAVAAIIVAAVLAAR